MAKHLNLFRCSWNFRKPSTSLYSIPLDLRKRQNLHLPKIIPWGGTIALGLMPPEPASHAIWEAHSAVSLQSFFKKWDETIWTSEDSDGGELAEEVGNLSPSATEIVPYRPVLSNRSHTRARMWAAYVISNFPGPTFKKEKQAGKIHFKNTFHFIW